MNPDQKKKKVETRRESRGGEIGPGKILKENIRAMVVNPKTGEVFRMEEVENQIQYRMCDILIMRLAGYPDYKINTMYMEYYNAAFMGAPGVPGFDRDAQIAYYTGLPANRDFLRVPLSVTPYLQSTDAAHYQNNRATFYAMSAGYAVGNNGEAFSVAAQSTVIGLALVVAPDASNQSEDIVVARAYLVNGLELDAVGRAISLEHNISAIWEP